MKKNQLELPTIGAMVDEWHSSKITFNKWTPDKIAILVDDSNGVCDVVFYAGKASSHLSSNRKDCERGDDWITEYMIGLTDEAPLVGFHGMSDA